jgi:type IV pilus assembly protein PilX
MSARQNFVREQRGAALIVALIMLLIITVLGIAATQSSVLGGKAARNERDREIAFQAAQSGLRDAIRDIESGPRRDFFSRNQGFIDVVNFDANGCTLTGNPVVNGGPGLCINQLEGTPIFLTRNLADPGSNVAVPFGQITGASFASRQSSPQSVTLPARPPVYVIEQINDQEQGQPPGLLAFRITALGFGVDESEQVLLQAVYRNVR